MDEKVCTKCGGIKPFCEFYKGRVTKDGMSYWCKECTRRTVRDRVVDPDRRRKALHAWRKRNQEKYRAAIKEWQDANKEKVKAAKKAWYEANKEKIKTASKLRYKANREKIKAASNAWYKTNKEKAKAASMSWFERNKDKMVAYRKTWQVENKDKMKVIRRNWRARHPITDPMQKLNRNIRNAIWRSLKSAKGGRHWEDIVGYTIDDLKRHLEKKFKPGMSWDNRGEWHIDHIIPSSVFNFTSPDHEDFKRCWALSNLQPLWAHENIKKSNKLTKHFQPMLNL